jgi:hypothetical protein
MHHIKVMSASTALKRKRSSNNATTVKPGRTPSVGPATTYPDSNPLFQKDKMIIQLRLELAEVNSELANTLKKLLDTECELFEA